MVQIDLTLEEDPVNDKPVRAGNGGAAAPVGVRSPKDKQQLMTEYLSPSNSQPAGSGDGSRRRERRALRASAAASGAGSSSSSKENPTVIYLSSDSDGGGDEDHACGGGAGGSQPRLPPLREIPGAPNGGHMHRGGGVANAGHSSSSSSSRGGRPAVRDQVPDDEPVIISDSEGEDDEPASPQPRLISKSVGIPPPPRPAEPSGRRKRSPSPAMPDDAGDKRARVGQTTPDHISGNDAAPISGPGSSLGIMMAEAELDAALALEDDDEHSMLVKRERDSEAVSKRLEELQEFYDRNFGGAEGGDGSKPRKPRGCSVCGQKGHNRRNCPTRSEQAAEEMEGGSGRGGGNARVDDLGDKGVVVADTESGGSGSGSGSGAVSGVCGASTSSSRRGGDREWLWDEDSQLAFRNAEVSSQTNLGYPHGKLWPVLRREAAMGGVAPAYVVRMMVEALLDPGMLEKMQNDADWKDLKGAKTEHLQHLFAGICHLIPAIGSNRFLPLEAPRGPRSYGQVNPCSELCADVMAAVKLLGTGAGEKGGRVGKAIEVEKLLSDDGGGSAAEKAKAEKCRQKQARKARADAYFRLQNVKCECGPTSIS